MKATFFPTPAAWRRWLAAHHATRDELWVGFHKKDTGLPSITWPESVDEALCYGWIDGIRRSLGASSYVIRFTPRRAGSNWSAVNLRRVPELKRARRMRAAGLRAFARRVVDTSYAYSYEQSKKANLAGADARAFKEREGVAVLPGAAAVVPARHGLVRHRRQARGNTPPATRTADRVLCERPLDPAGAPEDARAEGVAELTAARACRRAS